jgi:hypothetical protein
VGYSASKPEIFKRHQLLPIRDLKLLVRDYTPIASNVLTILINLSADEEVLDNLVSDDAFLETLLLKVTVTEQEGAKCRRFLNANRQPGEIGKNQKNILSETSNSRACV